MGEILAILLILIIIIGPGILINVLIIRAIIKYMAKCNANAFHYDELAKKIAQEIKAANQQ